MKFKSYEEMYQRDIWEVKKFLLRFASHYRFEGLAQQIYMAADMEELYGYLNHSTLYQQRLFRYIQGQFGESHQLEKQLVYMRLLLDWNFSLYANYRRKMLTHLKGLIANYLTSEIYVLLRHLLPKGKSVRRCFIERYSNLADEVQNYFLCEIYLIEEDYKMAYTYLKVCRYEGILKAYDEDLKAYSWIKYRLYAQKQPLFFKRKEGQAVWMKEQLKF